MISHRSTTAKQPGNSKSLSTRRIRTKPTLVSSAHRSTAYDRESGLVYDEVQVYGGKGSSTWITDYKTPKLVRTRVRPNEAKGARGLAEMVLGKLGLEAHELTVEALQPLPWVIGGKIWERICDK